MRGMMKGKERASVEPGLQCPNRVRSLVSILRAFCILPSGFDAGTSSHSHLSTCLAPLLVTTAAAAAAATAHGFVLALLFAAS